MPKDQGAVQGDVDGPLECCLASGMVVAETRMCIAAQAGSFPWIGASDDAELQQLRADHATRLQADFQLGGRKSAQGPTTRGMHRRKNGGLADLWYMDDGDIMCHPILVPSCGNSMSPTPKSERSGTL